MNIKRVLLLLPILVGCGVDHSGFPYSNSAVVVDGGFSHDTTNVDGRREPDSVENRERQDAHPEVASVDLGGVIDQQPPVDENHVDPVMPYLANCNLVTNEGCPSGQKCGTVSCMKLGYVPNMVTYCMQLGTKKEGETCNGMLYDDSACGVGLQCPSGRTDGHCNRYCYSNSDCPSATPNCKLNDCRGVNMCNP